MRRGLFYASACATLWLAAAGAADAQDVQQGQDVPLANAIATAPPGPRFLISPTFGVQEAFTDNALLTQDHRRSDFITRGVGALDANVNDGPVLFKLSGQAAYDRYASNTELSGVSFSGTGMGSYTLVPGMLAMELQGVVANGNVSTFGASALDRSGVENRTQLATYAVGPHLTTTIGGLFDVNAAARFDQVFYSAADSSRVTQLPTDSDIVQLIGRGSTGDRLGRTELMTSSQYERDNHGYHSVNAVESAFYRIAPELRLIGRAGYESVHQTGVTDINSPILSAGLELTLNGKSKITVEGGERYNRATWSASALVQISNRLYVTGYYTEVLQPDQLYIANSFTDFVDAQAELPLPLIPGSFSFDQNLYNQTSLNKNGQGHVVYKLDRQSFDFYFDYSDRFFLRSNTHDRTVSGNLAYSRQITQTWSAVLSGNYTHTFESPLFGASETFGFSAHLVYRVNSTVDVTGGYDMIRGRELFSGGETLLENAAMIALRKKF